MKIAKMKTLDISAKEWLDKVNGNSYFSARVTINFGKKSEKIIKLPMQYGYGSQFEEEAFKEVRAAGYPFAERQQSGVIVRSSIQTNCKKADVKNFGIN